MGSSSLPAVAGCRLVGCGVVSGRPLRRRAVAGVSQRVRVGLGPVLASRAPSPPAAAASVWRGLGRVPIAGLSYEEDSGPGSARTILLFHVIGASPSKQPLMVGSTLGV